MFGEDPTTIYGMRTGKNRGFSNQQVNSIILNARDQQKYDFLATGAVSDTIEVDSSVISVDTETAKVGAARLCAMPRNWESS